MFRPICSRSQNLELENTINNTQLTPTKPQSEYELNQSHQRYNDFLVALSKTSDLKPKTQKTDHTDSHERSTHSLNPINRPDLTSNSTHQLKKNDQSYFANHNLEQLNCQYHNPVILINRINADLNFRQSMLKSTR